jgi:hypothetical protein
MIPKIGHAARFIIENPCWKPATSVARFRSSGPGLGLDVGDINLAAVDTGKLRGGGEPRHHRDRYLALRRRL